jgi:hypothetical protein
MSTSGPTTKLRGLVNASGKSASDRVEQFSTTPRGRWLVCSAGSAVPAPPDVVRATAKVAATAVLAIAVRRKGPLQ